MSNPSHEGLSALLSDSEIEDVLSATFYRHEPEPVAARPARPRRAPKPKPDHYEVICISLYKEDLERLDAKVVELKQRGHRKMNRSSLIRFALDHVELDKLPRAY